MRSRLRAALFPKDVRAGLLGSELLEVAKTSGADLRQMQASAASSSTRGTGITRRFSRVRRERRHGIVMLTAEILALVVALVVTIVS